MTYRIKLIWWGKSGLYKDTVPVNGWRGKP